MKKFLIGVCVIGALAFFFFDTKKVKGMNNWASTMQMDDSPVRAQKAVDANQPVRDRLLASLDLELTEHECAIVVINHTGDHITYASADFADVDARSKPKVTKPLGLEKHAVIRFSKAARDKGGLECVVQVDGGLIFKRSVRISRPLVAKAIYWAEIHEIDGAYKAPGGVYTPPPVK